MNWLLGMSLAFATPEVVDWPIPFAQERKALTVAYLKEHSLTHPLSGELEKDVRMTPRVIVLHWTGGGSASSAWHTFASPTLHGRKDISSGGALNVGAHFIVDRKGTIFRIAEENLIMRHCIGLNHISIGIENVGSAKKELTPQQVAANIALIEDLAKRYPITHLIGHSEYRSFEGHPYFSEKNPKYRTIKPDPGTRFLAQVRSGLSVPLKAAPKGTEGVAE